MQEVCKKYARGVQEVCKKYARSMQEVCKKYARGGVQEVWIHMYMHATTRMMCTVSMEARVTCTG